MVKNFIKSSFLVTLSAILISCGSQAVSDSFSKENSVVSENLSSNVSDKTVRFDTNAIEGKKLNKKKKPQQNASLKQRKLIRTGNLKFETEDIQAAEFHIKSIVNELGGFISFEQQTRSNWSVRGDIEIRIPSDLFEVLMDSISNGNYAIEDKNIKVVDVTNQFVDTEIRLNTRKMVEEQYLSHLKKADNIQDVLEIERQVGYIREEIESAEGQLRKMSDQIALSTLKIEYYQTLDQPLKKEKNRFTEGLSNGWQGLQLFAVFLVNIWPMLVLTLGVLIFFRLRKKAKSK